MLASCSGGARGASPDDSSKDVGVELPLLTSPFWQAYDTYLPRYAREYGVKLVPPGNANGDTSKFLTDVQNMVTEGVRGLVLSPTDTAAVSTSLRRAQQAKIPVVAVDVAPESGSVFMVVRADNSAYGEKACEYIGTHVRTGKIVQIEGDLASINGRERTNAFDTCMKTKYAGIDVLEVPAQWDGEKAGQGLEAQLAANPDIKAVYIQAGGVYLSPTLSVLRRHGALLPVASPKHVIVVSNDGIPQELDAIRKGWIDATVSQPADAYARYGLYYIRAALDGKRFSAGRTDHGSQIVRLASGMLEDRLPAPLVTRANVDGTALWGNSLK
ncbi:MAG: sugar ABC transporter substrate-binding protein [Vulcanimicrobiaceae bacterium]